MLPVLAVLALAFSTASGRDDNVPFAPVGAVSTYLAQGAKTAPVTRGLAFDIVLTDGGRTIAGDHFDLKPQGASGAVKLALNGLKFDGGRLTALAAVQNDAGASIQGVRLDIAGASESYKAKDEKGQEVIRTRMQPVSIASPLYYADLAKGESAGPVAFDAGTITFAPETTQVVVHGLLSGLRYAGAFDIKGEDNPSAVAIDAQGRLYVSGIASQRVTRVGADGSNPTVLVDKAADQILGLALDPITGDLVIACINHKELFRLGSDGSAKGEIKTDPAVQMLRFDAKGSLYGTPSGLSKFTREGASQGHIEEAAGKSLDAKGFDVSPSGVVFLAGGLERDRYLFRIAPDLKSGAVLASGPDMRFGHLHTPQTVRVDASGQVYVIELGDNDNPCRVSVFGGDGGFVRAWGRAAQKAPEPDKLNEGQLWRPADICFAPTGRAYVVCENDSGFSKHLCLMYDPF